MTQMLHNAALAQHRAFAAAGALMGILQGLLRAAHGGKPPATATDDDRLSCLPSPSPQRSHHPLLNLVIVGDQGVGKTSLAYAFAGRAGRPEPTAQADFILHETAVAGVPATLTVWHLGGREAVPDIGFRFFSLAHAFLLAYDPSRGPEAAREALEHWSAVCLGRQGASHASLPLAVVACCRPVAEGQQQAAAALAAAQAWCERHGGLPHVAVQGLQDSAGVQRAFGTVLLQAVARQQRFKGAEAGVGGTAAAAAAAAGGTASAAGVSPPERLPVSSVSTSSSCGDEPLLELPALQSELGPYLQLLTPGSSHLAGGNPMHSSSEEGAAAVWPL